MSEAVPQSSEQIQTHPSYFAFTKAANTIGYFSLLYLTWRFFSGHLDWQLANGCIVLSACWLALTRIKVDHLLQTYYDVLSRIELILPVVMGCMLSVVAEIAHSRPLYHCFAVAEISGWIYIYILYRRNASRFEKQGYGPVPKGTWVSPPASVLHDGDLLLTSGRIAKGLREVVGHAELVVRMPDGKMMLLTSSMDKGCNLHPLEDVTGPSFKGYYIGLELKHGWSADQEKQAAKIAEEMVATNKKWAEEENIRVAKRIDFLPLPAQTKNLLKEKFKQTGYDWFGTFMGRVAQDRWTCIGAALEVYHRLGIQTNNYGTGLLGFGTTLFDPILPVRFLADDAFILIKQDKSRAPDKSADTSNSADASKSTDTTKSAVEQPN